MKVVCARNVAGGVAVDLVGLKGQKYPHGSYSQGFTVASTQLTAGNKPTPEGLATIVSDTNRDDIPAGRMTAEEHIADLRWHAETAGLDVDAVVAAGRSIAQDRSQAARTTTPDGPRMAARLALAVDRWAAIVAA
jgi:hypothetical protein